MDGKSEIKSIVRHLASIGWQIRKTGKSHWRATPPDPTRPIVFFGNTVSNRRALKNIRSQLIKSGLKKA